MKYFLVFSLFSCCLLESIFAPPYSTFTQTPPTYDGFIYKPMKDRDRNFGESVCFYKNYTTHSDAYVKPCEEGKKCIPLNLPSSPTYEIHTCQDSYEEVYDNQGDQCQTKDYHIGLDCTGYTCNSDSKCLDDNTCLKNQFRDNQGNCQSDDPGYCELYEFKENGAKSLKNSYIRTDGKDCVEIVLKKTNNPSSIYQIEKVLPNYYASLEDGTFIQDSSSSPFYCKSGYALYFYGDGELKNPNTATSNNDEQLYLRCVTILGRDSNNILKYKIGDGAEKYYDPSVYSHASTILNPNDKHLILKLKFFKNFRERLEGLSCKETNYCEDNELSKWLFFYYYPEYFFLYENEPQVLEYLIQSKGFPYKAKHTSSDASSFLNIKYLTLLALLLLF